MIDLSIDDLSEKLLLKICNLTKPAAYVITVCETVMLLLNQPILKFSQFKEEAQMNLLYQIKTFDIDSVSI